jgi:ribonuclease T2
MARFRIGLSTISAVALMALQDAAAQTFPADSLEAVLAATWQPAFCATEHGRTTPECRSLTPDRADALQFSLHGLWPDDLDDLAIFPCYCDAGTPRSCSRTIKVDRSAVELAPDVLARLSEAMPGVQSNLHLHEWHKHGSCYEDDKAGDDVGSDPNEYFSEAMAVLAQLNRSQVRALFNRRMGDRVTREDIERAFDEAFGAGAGERVLVKCGRAGRESTILELRINLKGDFANDDLRTLILAAPPVLGSSDDRSCKAGKVVRAGRSRRAGE